VERIQIWGQGELNACRTSNPDSSKYTIKRIGSDSRRTEEGTRSSRKRRDVGISEFPVLREADRVIYRIDEVICRRFTPMYSVDWNPKTLSIEDLDGNKKATAVYRLMRFFASYYMYQRRCSGLPFHPARGRLEWYVEKKIIPVFASGDTLATR
jgi:hypothetical protein